MPAVRLNTIDPRSIILREAEARQGFRNHTDMARHIGMKTSTLTKRFRLPGTATLDEIRAMVGGVLTADEALQLIGGKS